MIHLCSRDFSCQRPRQEMNEKRMGGAYSTQGATDRSTSTFKLAPVNPETGMNATSVFMLYPEPLRKGVSLPTISSYLRADGTPSARLA